MNEETRRAILTEQRGVQIGPADIRPGDVVEFRKRVNVTRIDSDGWIFSDTGAYADGCGGDWYLVHRPDPDAEARACAWAEYRKDYAPNPPALSAAHRAFLAGWQAAREQGWDVTRRPS